MSHQTFQWAVIGAGPAGIAAIGKLLDSDVSPKRILWLDPTFNVGDFGSLWRHVSSNTVVKLFINFLQDARSFDYQQAGIDFELNHLPPQNTCLLKFMAEPLRWISDHLSEKVHPARMMVDEIELSKNAWTLRCTETLYRAKNVILATGATPEVLNYPACPTIPFDIAIDKTKLSQVMNLNETVAVFGSSHSAIMIIKQLVELGVKKIVNFYQTPCRYAINLGDSILFDNTGLKGHTAAWARQHIDGALPNNLLRYPSNDATIADILPQCDKAIYAVGFKRRKTLTIKGYEPHHYNPHIGIIAPGLFGFGIAYPEIKADGFGNIESQVGLWKFMVYLNKVLPLWLNYHA